MYTTSRRIKTDIFLAIIFLIYIILLSTNNHFLPENFDFDARTIRLLINGQSDLDYGTGFRNTALIYSALGAERVFPEWLIILIANVVYWLVAIKVLGKSTFHRQNFFKIIFCLGWIFCSALYLSRYSKELLSLVPIFLICFTRMETHLQKVSVLLIVLAYVIFIRQYWALILAFYFAFHYLFFRVNASIPIKLITLAFIFFSPFWIVSILEPQYLTDWRVISNLDSSDPHYAKSAIVNLFTNTGPFTDYANALYAWLYLNIPIKLFIDEAIHHKAFALFQFGSVAILIATIYSEFKFHHERQMADDPFYSRCLSFILAYSLTQAIFEPDVGTFMRHQIILAVPLMYVVISRQKQAVLTV